MARSVTLQQIADRARVHADLKSSGFISDTEMLGILNEVYPELYDELVVSYENYYSTTENITLVAGTSSYALPATFYKMIGVDLELSSGAYVTLKPFMEAERNGSPTSAANIPAGTVRLRFVPAPTTFAALSESIDGVAGWDRLLSLLAAIDMLDSEETESGPLYKKYLRTLDRIRGAAAPRDAGFPARITDVSKPDLSMQYGSLRYRLQGGNIQFISTETLGAEVYW